MEISAEPLEAGRYVVAVSGGVDSAVLLHLLAGQPDLRLTVAHFDHGIRPDSAEDRRFVGELAQRYGVPYVWARAELGAHAGEDRARQARYKFLYETRRAAGAQAVVTAHHQDDVLETAIHNLIRGTGRRGLASLKPTDVIKRPLLHLPKADLVRYARRQALAWREDSTNAGDNYRRNYIRHNILSRFTEAERRQLHAIVLRARRQNEELEEMLGQLVGSLAAEVRQGRVQLASLPPGSAPTLDRRRFIMLPHAIAREVMAYWLRQQAVPDIDRRMVERLVHAAKTFTPGRRVSVTMDLSVMVARDNLALVRLER